MAIDRHRENLARGATARRLAAPRGGRLPHTRLAAALVALAARLDPALAIARPVGEHGPA